MSDNPYMLERYKYILEQKRQINGVTFKIAAFFQTVMIVLLGAQFQVIRQVTEGSLNIELARVASWGLFWITFGVSALSLAILAGGIFTWLDYKADEARIEEGTMGEVRTTPTFRSIFRWYETYMIIGIISVVVAYLYAMRKVILPTLA
jgi:hypothetical protein